MRLIVSDASSLILLTKVGLTEILFQNFKLVIPERVYEECVNQDTLKKYPDALTIQQWVLDKKIRVEKVDVSNVHYMYKINQGEKEAIALSLRDPESTLLTDDGNAVKIAKYLNKRFIISPLVVVDLYQMGKISYEKGKSSIEQLSVIGRYLPNLIADVLMMLGARRKEKERK